MSSGVVAALPRAERAAIRPWRAAVAVLVPLAAVTGVGAANGGFFPTSFGWTALAFAWGSVIAIAFLSPAWGPLDKVWAAAAAALCVFTFLSSLWAGSAADAVDEGFRSLVYLTGVAGALLVLRRRDIGLWLGGLVLGAAALSFYSLATRLFPNHFGAFNGDAGYRLFVPIGYWNALGIFAAMAALLGLGVAVAGRGAVLRVLSAASIVVLAATLYFTFSRGSWAALGVGVLAMFAFSPARLRLLTGAVIFGALPALGVLLASRAPALTHQSVAVASAAHDGRRLAVELALLAAAQAVIAVAYLLLDPRVVVPRSLRRAYTGAVGLAVLAAIAGVLVVYGSPSKIVRHAYDSFTAAPTSGSTNLNHRLFSLSNDGRTVLWRAALNDFSAHPVAGSGAGSFERWWLAHRNSAYFVQDAHNLYVETLAELGVIGAVLLAGLLGLPLVAAVRARAHPIVAPALGAYVAYLAHAIVDWDWEMPAVTLLALFTGAAIVAAARRGSGELRLLSTPVRVVLGGVAIVAAAGAFFGLIGSIALSRADAAIQNDDGPTAVSEATKAHRWAPWSAAALEDLGDGQVLAGRRQAGLGSLRRAAAKDPGDWEIWYDLAAATTGAEHRAALARAAALNPFAPEIARLKKLPGG